MSKLHITNNISQKFGAFARKEFPYTLQIVINWIYCKIFKIDLSNFNKLNGYKSLNELFTRELKIKHSFDNSDEVIISPCDSLITQYGKASNGTLLQIKGMEYNITDFLVNIDSKNIMKVINGSYANFYLSPKDYHRYHVPIDIKVQKVVHVTGKLYPVNLKYLNKITSLFCENERVIVEAVMPNQKLLYIVLVGALNVGQMVVDFEPKIETNKLANGVYEYNYSKAIKLKKGDCFGYFKMGSTIVMIAEDRSLDFSINSTKIKCTDTIARLI